LEGAKDIAQWQATTPVGLDLEYCMSSSPELRGQVRTIGVTHLRILLEDDRTMVASENTCLALVLEYMGSHPVISQSDRKALMEAVHWKWLSSSFICSLTGSAFIPASMQAQLQRAAMFEPDARDTLLTHPPADSYFLPRAAGGRRPASSVAQLELEWEVSCEALRATFGTNRKLITEPRMHLFGGLSWGVQLWWRERTAEPGTWHLRLQVLAGTPAGAELPQDCMVGVSFQATLAGRSLGSQVKGFWQVGNTRFILANDVLGGGLKGWPERAGADGRLLQRIRGGMLRGSVVVHEVL
jgi:hypothetical protein